MNIQRAATGPFISVIIPLFDTERYILQALQSIAAQTRPVGEIVVVDDGSTDGGAALAEGFPGVRLIRKQHSGLWETMNRGLAEVRGEYVALLDADDRWLPGKVEWQAALLDAEPELDLVFGQARRFQMVSPATSSEERVLDVMPGVASSGGMFRRRVFDRVGVYPTHGTNHGFLDWYARVQQAGLRIRIEAEVCFERRIHDRNMGIVGKAQQRKGYFAALKAKLDRERAGAVGRP